VDEQREPSQFIGEALREAAVLIAVLYPLETIVTVQFDPKREIDWWYIGLSWLISGILFWWGIILEGRNEL
jgi:hypothetical protein